MIHDVSIPTAENHPVAVALRDPDTQRRLKAAARAFLGRSAANVTAVERAQEAEAIAQEACLRAWNHRDAFDQHKNAVTWFIGFVRNVAREAAKRHLRRTGDPPPDGPALDELAVDATRPVDQQVVEKLFVAELLQNLSTIDQLIVRMKHADGKTCDEIGQHIGMKENAVRIRLFRAMTKLRALCGVAGEGQS